MKTFALDEVTNMFEKLQVLYKGLWEEFLTFFGLGE